MESNTYIEVAVKKKLLDDVASRLKQQFVGLDHIIDDMMTLVTAWYIFPKAQLRPCVINLWGLTGSGKTALVTALVDLLGHRKYYVHFDMGDFQSEKAKGIKRFLLDDLTHFHEQQVIICLDEFQFARSIDKGEEVMNDKLRTVWELVDSGKILYTPDANQFTVKRAEMAIAYLSYFMAKGGEIKNGVVIAETELFIQLFSSFFFETYDRYGEAMSKDYLKSKDFVEGVTTLSENAKDDVVKAICKGTLADVIELLKDLVKNAVTVRELDLRRCLVFVLGNLDEAYKMSSNLDPDMDADDMHEATKKITIATIKNALTKRFRSEQVARLGNNHLIYRAFSMRQFKEVICRELQRLTTFAFQEFDWQLSFDESIVEIVYSEGVIPTQGTRPVLTTINNLIQSRIGLIALHVSEVSETVASVSWSCEEETFRYELKDDSGKVLATISEPVSLQLGKQRASENPYEQAHTAVHEVGHAILAALTLRILPSVVMSRTASCDSEGFCRVRFPKGPFTRETLKKDIVISLGGFAAEKLVFGEEYTCSGVGSDISQASMLANDAIRRYAMGSDAIRLAVVKSVSNEDYFVDTDAYEDEAVKLVRECLQDAEAILGRNKLLLLEMSKYLTYNSKMNMDLIGEFVKKYSTEDWVNDSGFIEPEDYFKFDRILESQLDDLIETEKVGERLISEVIA